MTTQETTKDNAPHISNCELQAKREMSKERTFHGILGAKTQHRVRPVIRCGAPGAGLCFKPLRRLRAGDEVTLAALMLTNAERACGS
jgi:hypothetical protein